jgi:hypothetical protein
MIDLLAVGDGVAVALGVAVGAGVSVGRLVDVGASVAALTILPLSMINKVNISVLLPISRATLQKVTIDFIFI